MTETTKQNIGPAPKSLLMFFRLGWKNILLEDPYASNGIVNITTKNGAPAQMTAVQFWESIIKEVDDKVTKYYETGALPVVDACLSSNQGSSRGENLPSISGTYLHLLTIGNYGWFNFQYFPAKHDLIEVLFYFVDTQCEVNHILEMKLLKALYVTPCSDTNPIEDDVVFDFSMEPRNRTPGETRIGLTSLVEPQQKGPVNNYKAHQEQLSTLQNPYVHRPQSQNYRPQYMPPRNCYMPRLYLPQRQQYHGNMANQNFYIPTPIQNIPPRYSQMPTQYQLMPTGVPNSNMQNPFQNMPLYSPRHGYYIPQPPVLYPRPRMDPMQYRQNTFRNQVLPPRILTDSYQCAPVSMLSTNPIEREIFRKIAIQAMEANANSTNRKQKPTKQVKPARESKGTAKKKSPKRRKVDEILVLQENDKENIEILINPNVYEMYDNQQELSENNE